MLSEERMPTTSYPELERKEKEDVEYSTRNLILDNWINHCASECLCVFECRHGLRSRTLPFVTQLPENSLCKPVYLAIIRSTSWSAFINDVKLRWKMRVLLIYVLFIGQSCYAVEITPPLRACITYTPVQCRRGEPVRKRKENRTEKSQNEKQRLYCGCVGHCRCVDRVSLTAIKNSLEEKNQNCMQNFLLCMKDGWRIKRKAAGMAGMMWPERIYRWFFEIWEFREPLRGREKGKE